MHVRRFGFGESPWSAITTRSVRRAMSPRHLVRRATAAEGVPDGARLA